MTLTFTILGCGASMGVPRAALGWGACNPDNPKNRRRRCPLLVERENGTGGRTTILVDTTPDCSNQTIDAGVTRIDAVLFTHAHADHCHGIDDLRPFFIKQRQRVPAYLDASTAEVLLTRFDYCFVTPPGSDYPPILDARPISAGTPFTVEGEGGPITVMPVLHQHGNIPALGFRFDGVAYSPDLNAMPDESAAALDDLDVWIVDALRYKPHPSHLSLDETLDWIARLKPRRAVLTNMHTDIDYDEVGRRVPDHVTPAHDGLRFSVPKSA